MEIPKKIYLPNLGYTRPFYTTLQIGKLEACHADVIAARDLSCTISCKSAALVQAAVAESARVEAFLDTLQPWLSPEVLITHSTERLGDFALAALAQAIWETADKIADGALREQCFQRHTELLVQALLSSDASVLLDYDSMYIDMANSSWLGLAADPIDLLERGLAHHLAYNSGNRAVEILLNTASIHLTDGAWVRGIGIYVNLMLYDPCDFEVYDALASDLANGGELSNACRVARRGLEVAVHDSSGCREALLAADLEQWETRKDRGSDHIDHIPAEEQELLENALHIDVPCGATLDELCTSLFPHLDEVPLKPIPSFALTDSHLANRTRRGR